MAGQADGRILVDTAIDPDGFAKDAKTLQSEAQRLSGKVDALGKAFKRALSGDPKALEAYRAAAAELQQTVERLAADMAKLGAKKAPTDAYKDLSAETEKAGRALQKLLDRQEQLENRGASKTSQTWKNLQADIEAASARYDELAAKKAQMETSGAAWKSGTETAEYQSMAAAVDAVNARLGAMNAQIDQTKAKMAGMSYSRSLWTDLTGAMSTAMGAVQTGIASAMQQSQGFAAVVRTIQYAWNTVGGVIKRVVVGALQGALNIVKSITSAIGRVVKGVFNLAKNVAGKLLSAFKSVLSTVKKLFVGNKSLSGSMGDLTSAIKRLAPAMLAAKGAVSILRKAVDAFLSANEQVSNQLQACWSNLGNILGPVITRIVNLVTTAISYVTAFLQLLGFGVSSGGGASTISTVGKAVAGVGSAAKIAAVKTDEFGNKSAVALTSVGGAATIAADEINTVGDAAESTAKKIQNLSGLDQLNTWKSDQSAGGGGGGGAGGGIGDLGVTLPTVELPDWAKLIAEQLRSGEWAEAAKTLSDKLNEMVDGIDWESLGDRLGEKVAGVIKFLATFIREFDFADLFTGLFTALKAALENVDAEDVGTLLAGKFVLIFSALQGLLESDVIPAAIAKLGGIIEGFFATVRDKFNDESDPEHGGWYVVGQNIGNLIGQIINSIASLLSGTNWSQIVGDIGEFWGGLWDALRSGSYAPNWGALFDAIQIACKRLLVRMLQWLPQSGDSRRVWKDLEGRLETDGHSVEWREIFGAIWATLMDLVDLLIDALPSPTELSVYWAELKDKFARAIGYADWDTLKSDLDSRLTTLFVDAFDAACDAIYVSLKGRGWFTDAILSHLFPDKSHFDAMAEQFQRDYESSGMHAALANLHLDVVNSGVTKEEALQIINGYTDAMYDSYDDVLEAITYGCYKPIEDSAADGAALAQQAGDTVGGTYVEGVETGVQDGARALGGNWLAAHFEEELDACRARMEQGGIDAALAYIQTLVDEGVLNAAEASQLAQEVANRLKDEQADEIAIQAAESMAQAYLDQFNGDLSELETAVDTHAGGAANAMVGHAEYMYARTIPHIRSLREDGAGHVAGLEQDVESAYGAMADTVAEDSAGMEADSDTSWSAMRTLLADKAGRMQAKVAETYDAMGKKVANIMAQSQKDNSGAWTAMETDGANATASIQEKTERAWEAVLKAVGAYMAQALEAAQEKWSAIEAATAAAGTSIRESVTAAWSGAAGAVTAQINSLKNSAYSWGSDFGAQFANGIRGAIGRIASAASSAASTVRSYLHFSVPDKGPLADADAYGPDFIRLLADGMTKKKGLAARAAADVASAISDGVQGGSAAGGTLAALTERIEALEALAAPLRALGSVPAPALASGTVLPPRTVYADGPVQGLGDVRAQLQRLLDVPDGVRGGGNIQYTFIGQIDRKVLFQQVLDEGQARRGRSGQNPFLLGG